MGRAPGPRPLRGREYRPGAPPVAACRSNASPTRVSALIRALRPSAAGSSGQLGRTRARGGPVRCPDVVPGHSAVWDALAGWLRPIDPSVPLATLGAARRIVTRSRQGRRTGQGIRANGCQCGQDVRSSRKSRRGRHAAHGKATAEGPSGRGRVYPARNPRSTVRSSLSGFGSSNAIDCQVPSASRPSTTGTVSDGGTSSGRTWSAP